MDFSKTTFTRKEVLQVKNLLYSGVQVELVSGETNVKNPVKLQENKELIKNKLVSMFYEVPDAENLDSQEFETKIKSIIDYAKNYGIGWITEFDFLDEGAETGKKD